MPWSMPTGCWGSTALPAAMKYSSQLVLARIIEPASELDSLRVLKEAGLAPVSSCDAWYLQPSSCPGWPAIAARRWLPLTDAGLLATRCVLPGAGRRSV